MRSTGSPKLSRRSPVAKNIQRKNRFHRKLTCVCFFVFVTPHLSGDGSEVSDPLPRQLPSAVVERTLPGGVKTLWQDKWNEVKDISSRVSTDIA